MIFVACGVISILFVFVIPKIKMIFDAQNVALPLPTTILINLSLLITQGWWVMLTIFLGGTYLIRKYINSKKGKTRWDKFLLKIPIFGPLIRMLAIVRFSKTLATLLGSGVPLLTAFDIVKNVIQNNILSGVLQEVRDSVKEGESIATPLKRSGEFPPIVTHMIAIGEKAGELERMLGNIAKSYEVQIDARLQAMTSLLEPILLVVMGVIVSFIVFSILLPMLQLSQFAG